MAKFLIDHTAEVDAKDKKQLTPLHASTKNGKFKVYFECVA